MGSWFSSRAAAGGDRSMRHVSLISARDIGRGMSKEKLARLDPDPEHYGPGPGPVFTEEEVVADCICRLAHHALKHYNANNQDDVFEYPAESTTEMKAAWVAFGEHFLWYHLRFSAQRSDDEEMHLFFAELCYDLDSHNITVKTCTILEEPLCRFRSSCAFCPEESKIMHPSDAEFVCGKEGQQTEFFRTNDIEMLMMTFDTCTDDLDLGFGELSSVK